MAYQLLNDEEIVKDLGQKIEYARRLKGLQSKELCEKGGAGYTAYRNLVNGKNGVSLKTFVALLRGLGELDTLEKLLAIQSTYSPTGKMSEPKKRIFKKKSTSTETMMWGDEQ